MIAVLLLGCGPRTVQPVPDTAEAPSTAVVDADNDGWPADVDCDDDDGRIYPGAELASRSCHLDRDLDFNCDGLADWREDFDGDGFSDCENDCDDHDPTFSPAADDPIDGVDQNCDGTDGVGEFAVRLEVGRQPDTGMGSRVLGAM